MSTSSASLASLVYVPERLKHWTRLDDIEPLGKLHTRFWGIPITRHVQQQSSDPSEGEDKHTDMSEEDDTKGGYVLEIHNAAIHMKRIWVRAEYIRIYDFLVDYYNKKTAYKGIAPAAVVTGQPGIGKTVWVYYALCRCLAEKRPVIWRHDFWEASYKTIIWTLIDSDQSSQNGFPTEFSYQDMPFYIIYCTSSASEHWSRLEKAYRLMYVVMNPWTRGEINQVKKVFGDLLPGVPANSI